MIKDWEIPDPNLNGDDDPAKTYEAVGRAITAWEYVELELAQLYAIFKTGNRFEFELWQEYGDAGAFRHRVRNLEAAAQTYFVGHPSQSLEGEFFQLSQECLAAGARRNEIVHGVVASITVPASWALLPTAYMGIRNIMAPLSPDYTYRSAELDEFERKFARLGTEMRDYSRKLRPNPYEGSRSWSFYIDRNNG